MNSSSVREHVVRWDHSAFQNDRFRMRAERGGDFLFVQVQSGVRSFFRSAAWLAAQNRNLALVFIERLETTTSSPGLIDGHLAEHHRFGRVHTIVI